MTLAGKQSDTPKAQESHLHIVRRLRRAMLSINRCGDAMFSPYRLTTDQYSLLRAVHRQPGVRQADLGNFIFAEPNTITAMVSLLEKRGILRRKPHPTDGRVRLLYLTMHGQTVLQRLSEDWRPMRKVLLRCFAGEEGERALLILDQVYEDMQHEREKLLTRLETPQAEEANLSEPATTRVAVNASGTSGKAKANRAAKGRKTQLSLAKDR
ncbi:MAG TPA: MarR family transcriptional regulator [Granulicella sp.]